MVRALVLASASPRRREILSGHGFSFEVRPADVDESLLPGETPFEHVARVARDKARAVSRRFPRAVVLGADTVIAFRGRVIGKPRDEADAERILQEISGEEHQVLTGFCLRVSDPERELTDVVSTAVVFRELSRSEIEAYVATGEPMDKAGAYGVQGGASEFVDRLEGSLANVIGLPIERIAPILVEWSASDE